MVPLADTKNVTSHVYKLVSLATFEKILRLVHVVRLAATHVFSGAVMVERCMQFNGYDIGKMRE